MVSQNPFRFAGGFQESNGLYKFGARYYDSNIDRFTQMDPSEQEANAYSYAKNNHIVFSDPSGLAGGGYVGAIVSAIVGFAALLARTSFPLVGCLAVSAFYGALGAALGAAVSTAIDGGSKAAQKRAFFDNLGPGAIAGIVGVLLGKIVLKIAAATKAS